MSDQAWLRLCGGKSNAARKKHDFMNAAPGQHALWSKVRARQGDAAKRRVRAAVFNFICSVTCSVSCCVGAVLVFVVICL